jgi:hypothetical protein
MMRFRPDYLCPEIPSSIREIMSDPAFEFGVADVRAGRSRRPDYDLWHKINDQWAHERGRMWALLAPRDIQLKRDSKITNDLAVRAARYRDHLMVQEGSDLSPRTGNFSLCDSRSSWAKAPPRGLRTKLIAGLPATSPNATTRQGGHRSEGQRDCGVARNKPHAKRRTQEK